MAKQLFFKDIFRHYGVSRLFDYLDPSVKKNTILAKMIIGSIQKDVIDCCTNEKLNKKIRSGKTTLYEPFYVDDYSKILDPSTDLSLKKGKGVDESKEIFEFFRVQFNQRMDSLSKKYLEKLEQSKTPSKLPLNQLIPGQLDSFNDLIKGHTYANGKRKRADAMEGLPKKRAKVVSLMKQFKESKSDDIGEFVKIKSAYSDLYISVGYGVDEVDSEVKEYERRGQEIKSMKSLLKKEEDHCKKLGKWISKTEKKKGFGNMDEQKLERDAETKEIDALFDSDDDDEDEGELEEL